MGYLRDTVDRYVVWFIARPIGSLPTQQGEVESVTIEDIDRYSQQMLWDLDVHVAKDVIAQAVKTRKERETPVLVTTDKENVEGEAAAEWADGFGESDWDEQPPGLDWVDPNYEPDYDKSVPHLV